MLCLNYNYVEKYKKVKFHVNLPIKPSNELNGMFRTDVATEATLRSKLTKKLYK